MMKRLLATVVTGATLSTGALVAGPVASAGAADCPGGSWPSYVNGRPTEIAVGDTGMALWHNEHGWHLRVSEAGKDPAVFTGTVSSDGRVVSVGAHLDKGDRIVRRSPSKVVYVFSNFGGLDGMDFGIACGSQVTVSGRLNGHVLDPTTVYIGEGNAHPESMPVTITKE